MKLQTVLRDTEEDTATSERSEVNAGESPLQELNQADAWQYVPELSCDSHILMILKDHRNTLKWLDDAEPTADVPDVHKEPVKVLEKLGFVVRRNNRTFSLGRQRIKRVLARESHYLSFQFTFEDLIRREFGLSG